MSRAVREISRRDRYIHIRLALMSNHAHILLSSGPQGLPSFMRRFLTGYAVHYNLRHRRNGHLFQNRYKSMVCDGDSYFSELVRYIHLNPLRVKLVADFKGLETYPYCGHGVILGAVKNDWQDEIVSLRSLVAGRERPRMLIGGMLSKV